MSKDYKELAKDQSMRIGGLMKVAPVKGFMKLHEETMAAGALDPKTKELIALALGVAAHCDGCIALHTKAALANGATREEIQEALAVAVMMGGGPSLIYASDALTAIDQLSS